MLNFNPFYPPKTKNIQQKIFHLQTNYPGLPCQELAKKLISKKCFWCVLVGVISAYFTRNRYGSCCTFWYGP